MKIIWLDDIRNPKKFLNNYNDYDEVIWVHNFDEFVKNIKSNNIENISISFDHDLGEDLSGYDCAKFLVNYCLDYNIELPKNIYIHSANPVGAENIKKLIENYRKFRNLEK